jgi:hypothetical protein
VYRVRLRDSTNSQPDTRVIGTPMGLLTRDFKAGLQQSSSEIIISSSVMIAQFCNRDKKDKTITGVKKIVSDRTRTYAAEAK